MNRLDEFVERTNDLIKLHEYFWKNDNVPQYLKIVYSDFYLKNIISNAYTNFEMYIRNSLTDIVQIMSNMEYLDSNLISQELKFDLIKKCLGKLPTNNINLITKPDKVKCVCRLSEILNEQKISIIQSEHLFDQLPHSVSELEKLMCKYLNQERILYDINVRQRTELVEGLEIDADETAFAFLNRIVSELRHPIVHEGVTVYMNEEYNVNDDYINLILENYIAISSKIESLIVQYKIALLSFKRKLDVSKEMKEQLKMAELSS